MLFIQSLVPARYVQTQMKQLDLDFVQSLMCTSLHKVVMLKGCYRLVFSNSKLCAKLDQIIRPWGCLLPLICIQNQVKWLLYLVFSTSEMSTKTKKLYNLIFGTSDTCTKLDKEVIQSLTPLKCVQDQTKQLVIFCPRIAEIVRPTYIKQ